MVTRLIVLIATVGSRTTRRRSGRASPSDIGDELIKDL
jgi:hypothetical protein